MFPMRMWSWGLMTLSLRGQGSMSLARARASGTSLLTDGLGITAVRSSGGGVCLVFQPGDVLLRSYPKNK